MHERLVLPWLILKVGFVVTLLHDYFYAKADGTAYELGGAISHAGADMLILTALIIVAVMVNDGPWRK